MEKCPPEIHSRIFQYACTDDGATGCALSLVSRYIREVSYPYQWQCISLAGFKRVVRLANTIQSTSSKRPIYHLFLSDRYSPHPNCFPHPDDQTAYIRDLLPALTTILIHTTATLETVVFYSDASFFNGAASVRDLLSFTYPRLRELTIRARCTPCQLASSRLEDVLPSNCPRLERLHLALPYHGLFPDNLQATHDLVRSISPMISHLRLTMLDKWGNKQAVNVLHAELAAAGIVPKVLDLPPSDWAGPSTTVALPVTWDRLFPENLRFFAIQPSPTSMFYCSCCMDQRGDVDVMWILEHMSAIADKDRFAFMDRRPITARKCRSDPLEVAGYGYVEARIDWMERIAGGSGCWKQRDLASLEDDETAVDKNPSRPPSVIFCPKLRTSRVSRLRNAFRRFFHAR